MRRCAALARLSPSPAPSPSLQNHVRDLTAEWHRSGWSSRPYRNDRYYAVHLSPPPSCHAPCPECWSRARHTPWFPYRNERKRPENRHVCPNNYCAGASAACRFGQALPGPAVEKANGCRIRAPWNQAPPSAASKRPRDMFLLTGMRGAGHGKIGILEAEGIRRAAFDQRKSLNGFDGRTRECRAFYVAQRKNIAAIAIDHRDGTTMAAFDDRATINFHQNRIAFHHFNLTPQRHRLPQMQNSCPENTQFAANRQPRLQGAGFSMAGFC